MFDNLLRNLTI